MTKAVIVPISTDRRIAYQAVAGEKRSQGATAGAALDALTAQLADDEAGTLVVVQSQRPDRFFDAEQQKPITRLMADWHSARAQGQALCAAQQAELEALVEAELRASAARASVLADELGR